MYVTEPGSILRTRGGRLRVTKSDTTILAVSLKRTRQILAHGRVGMTTPFLHRALAQGVDLVLLEENGDQFLGRLTGPAGTDVELRHLQHRLIDRETPRLQLARAFVSGKITNMRTALLRAARAHRIPEVEPAAARLLTARRDAAQTPSIPALMGFEGTATRDYFAVLGRLLGEAWNFTHRARRPPPDPVNAMLSFGYTLLAREAVAALEIVGLDPAVGFLHELHRARPSLALDLIEEFRPVIVDTLVATLCTSGKLGTDGFDLQEKPQPSCRMTRETLKLFLAAYERRMLTMAHRPYAAPPTAPRWPSARLLANMIQGRAPAYVPLAWR